MPVVAHHPIIVHLECVLVCLIAIDEYLAITHLEFVFLISADGTLIDGQIVKC